VHHEHPFAFSGMLVMPYILKNVSLGGPYISIPGLIKRSYHSWMSMMTSSKGPLFSFALDPQP